MPNRTYGDIWTVSETHRLGFRAENAFNLIEKSQFERGKLRRNLFGYATYDYDYNYTILKRLYTFEFYVIFFL